MPKSKTLETFNCNPLANERMYDMNMLNLSNITSAMHASMLIYIKLRMQVYYGR